MAWHLVKHETTLTFTTLCLEWSPNLSHDRRWFLLGRKQRNSGFKCGPSGEGLRLVRAWLSAHSDNVMCGRNETPNWSMHVRCYLMTHWHKNIKVSCERWTREEQESDVAENCTSRLRSRENVAWCSFVPHGSGHHEGRYVFQMGWG
jgi:hypothetical protein